MVLVEVVLDRVELLPSFEKLVFAITSRILRILMEHIDSFCRSESRPYFDSVCSVGILDIFEVELAKTSFSKVEKCSTLVSESLRPKCTDLDSCLQTLFPPSRNTPFKTIFCLPLN